MVLFRIFESGRTMTRSPRADESGCLYHALNRGNLRATIFHKPEDYVAFEKILHDALDIHKVELYSYLLMPSHYHLVLRPMVEGRLNLESTMRPRGRKRVRSPEPKTTKEA